MDQRLAALALHLTPGVGPRLQTVLLERFGSAADVLKAPPSDLASVPGIGPKLLAKIRTAADRGEAERTVAECEAEGIDILFRDDDAYPQPLTEIPDPPMALFCRGELRPSDALSIAIVGTRHGTAYGRRVAERLAAALARAGLCVVSGLARGIDGHAHKGALAAEGRTIAVLGSGLANIYPPEHAALADEVARNGALLSELPPKSPPLSGTFPQRNRIITGLSLGVIVVEAGDRSGALISANHAKEQNREVLAVPGSIESRVSRGCHRLIKDGAVLVESVDDVLEALGYTAAATRRDEGPPVKRPAELSLNEQEKTVLAAVGEESTLIDEVVAGSGLPTSNVLATLSVLEMKRMVRRLGGNRVMRI